MFLWTFEANNNAEYLARNGLPRLDDGAVLVEQELFDTDHSEILAKLGIDNDMYQIQYPSSMTNGRVSASVYTRYVVRPYDDGPTYVGSLITIPIELNGSKVIIPR